MAKSKRKHENPFAKHLWQTEQVLWMGKPKGQRWQDIRRLSEPLRPIENKPIRNWLYNIVGVLSFAGFSIVLLLVGSVLYGGSLVGVILMVTCILPFLAMLLLPLVQYFYAKQDVYYAITNRRVLVLHNGRCRELLHELILKAGIEQHGQSQSIAWDEGQVAFFPPFVGIENAEYLVQLVEEARQKAIPIIAKTWFGMATQY